MWILNSITQKKIPNKHFLIRTWESALDLKIEKKISKKKLNIDPSFQSYWHKADLSLDLVLSNQN